MADEVNEDNATQEVVSEASGTASLPDASTEGTPDANAAGESASADEEQKSKLSPEDALAALEATRKEAAKYRTQLREAQEKLGKAVTEEEFRQVKHELVIQRVINETGIPPQLATRLTGDSYEAIKADAESLKAFITPAAPGKPAPTAPATPTPSGGAQPTSTSVSSVEAALKHARSSRVSI